VSLEGEKAKFFIFPLTNINLFPCTTKPLHIFESRYIQMVNESIQTGVPIALCFVPEGTTEIQSIAGYAVPQIIEIRPDQTLLVFMAGEGKVQLDLSSVQTIDSVTSMSGRIIRDNSELSYESRALYVTLSEVVVRWVTQHIIDPVQRDFFIKGLTGPREVVGAFSAYLLYDADLQYEVMEIESVDQQILFLNRLLQSGKVSR
jgi:uncharacterized protein